MAEKIGHNLARTNYDVDRSRRGQAAAEREAPAPPPKTTATPRTANATPARGF